MITIKSTFGAFGLASMVPAISMAQSELPNFVFMMAEDVAPHFVGLYNEGRGAQLPNLESMASEGIVFNNAYSCAPVSSAARSTLFTSCYAPRLGVSFHRKLQEVPMPEDQYMFPAYLRKAGYFTVNAAKTDYNCITDTTAWNIIRGKMGGWRKRTDKNQPFLFVKTNPVCHESCLHFTAQQMAERKTFHSPESANLLPMHPDTELFRYTYATFYDRIRKVDDELGEMIQMLKQDGLLDNTFIFYMGDNGGSLPGTKGYTLEPGLKVPLVVYVPRKWRDRLPVSVNSRVDGFVSFMDLGPTLLHLAGIEVPEGMDGTPFMGEDITQHKMNERDVVYGYGDRFDELYASNRTVRKGNLKYSRNFTPYHPKSLYALYRYKQLAFVEWKQMYEDGKLNEVQSRFFEPQGAEELYDLANDPYETNNLASLAEYKEDLQDMRKLLSQHMLDMNDLGIFPECIWFTEGNDGPVSYGVRSHDRLCAALDAANLQLLSFSKGKAKALKALKSQNPVIRYWALTACINWGEEAAALVPAIQKMQKKEKEPFVSSRAMVFLSRMKAADNPVKEFKTILKKARGTAECLNILNDMAYMKEQNPEWKWNVSADNVLYPNETTDWRLLYLNAE